MSPRKAIESIAVIQEDHLLYFSGPPGAACSTRLYLPHYLGESIHRGFTTQIFFNLTYKNNEKIIRFNMTETSMFSHLAIRENIFFKDKYFFHDA